MPGFPHCVLDRSCLERACARAQGSGEAAQLSCDMVLKVRATYRQAYAHMRAYHAHSSIAHMDLPQSPPCRHPNTSANVCCWADVETVDTAQALPREIVARPLAN